MTTPPADSAAPSARQLLRSTIIAAAVALVLLVTCVLPAEYGKDPTGIGRVLGLTQMGEVKLALAEEAASNAAAEASADSVIAAAESAPETAGANIDEPATAKAALRSDTTEITLAPGKSAEVKLRMPANAVAAFRWESRGGVVNFDMHGDSTNAPKDWFVSYRKGQGVPSDSGELVAGFNGNHGWFWRNRGAIPVTVRLITSGPYNGIDKHL